MRPRIETAATISVDVDEVTGEEYLALFIDRGERGSKEVVFPIDDICDGVVKLRQWHMQRGLRIPQCYYMGGLDNGPTFWISTHAEDPDNLQTRMGLVG